MSILDIPSIVGLLETKYQDDSKLIDLITVDLPKANIDEARKLIAKLGFVEAARLLGLETSSYDNLLLAGRLIILDLYKKVSLTIDGYLNATKGLLHPNIVEFISKHKVALQEVVNNNMKHDFEHDFFSANTLVATYLSKSGVDNLPIEAPQFLYLRVVTQFFYRDGLEKVLECYNVISDQLYTPASPQLFNAGKIKNFMGSCFLISIGDTLDSILHEGLYVTGKVSAALGGIGLGVGDVRAKGSKIGIEGVSQGIIPMLVMYNGLIRYADQTGKRKGAMTVYNNIYHLEVEEFVQLLHKTGDPNARAHDLNLGLWVPDLFWKRLIAKGKWTLFCPSHSQSILKLYGAEFEKEYTRLEQDSNVPKKVVDAENLFRLICETQIQSGALYIMSDDACNIKSNQRHLGHIRSSNLCTEIVEYSDPDTISTCNLSSINLKKFIRGRITENADSHSICVAVDFPKLGDTSRLIVRALNRVIDYNRYPLDTDEKKGPIGDVNDKHRPLGIGLSGFADSLALLDIPFECESTRRFNKMVFACMYFNCLIEGIRLSIIEGPHSSFQGSPMSEGKLQFDLWHEEFLIRGENKIRKEVDDLPLDPSVWGQQAITIAEGDIKVIIEPTWSSLTQAIVKYGVRNSLYLTVMPTASSSSLLRNSECCEPFTSNFFTRKVSTKSYPVINKYMIEDFTQLGIWNDTTYEYLQMTSGTIAGFIDFIKNNTEEYPDFKDFKRLEYLTRKYKTIWEISQRFLVILAAERGRYIDQSQSQNIHLKNATYKVMLALQITNYLLGIKTFNYYIRQQPQSETIKFGINPKMIKANRKSKDVNQGPLKLESPKRESVPLKGKCDGEVCTNCQ